MNHLTQLQMSMLADSALSGDEANTITEHLESCATCQARLAALRDEAQLIASALQIEAAEDSSQLLVPKFSRPTNLRGFAVANLTTGLVIWLAQFLWKTIFGELVVNATSWVTSIYLPDIYAVASAAALYLIEEGTAMFDAYLSFVVVSFFALTAVSLLLIYRKGRTTLFVCLVMAMLGTTVAPAPVNALDLRRSEDVVTIARSETVDDTLLVAAETVLIEGVVTGDVFAVGNRIEVSGTVQGTLVTLAESVMVRGEVGGDLWVAGERVGIDNTARIGRNATVATEAAVVEGAVEKDLHAFAETVELNGVLGEDLEAFANRVRLLGDAHVGGNVRFRSDNEDRLYRAETARVDGEVEFLGRPEWQQKRNRYATVQFYLWQIARLAAAFLVGVAILWLVPGYRSLSIGAGIDTVKTAGFGFLALVSVPIMTILVAFTLVGLPLSFIAIVAWLLGLYLAKIVVGAFIGRMLLSESAGFPWALLVGLTIVIVAVNLPFIGGIINFLLTLVGLGLVVQHLISNLPVRGSGEATPA